MPSYDRDTFMKIGEHVVGGSGDAGPAIQCLSEGIPLRDGNTSIVIEEYISPVGAGNCPREGVYLVGKPIPSKFDLEQMEKIIERKNSGMDYVHWIHPPSTSSLSDRFAKLQAELFRKSRESNSKKAPLGTNRKVRQAINVAAASASVPNGESAPPRQPSKTARSLNQKMRRKYIDGGAGAVKRGAVLRITHDPNKPVANEDSAGGASVSNAESEKSGTAEEELRAAQNSDSNTLSGGETGRDEVESPSRSDGMEGGAASSGTSDEENRSPDGGQILGEPPQNEDGGMLIGDKFVGLSGDQLINSNLNACQESVN